MIRLLLDEPVSRSVASRLRAQGIDAIHIGERGLANRRFPDHAVWRRAVDDARILVTINARDFRALAAHEEIHAGLITFPSGATSAEQFRMILSAVSVLAEDELRLMNQWLEMREDGIEIRVLYREP